MYLSMCAYVCMSMYTYPCVHVPMCPCVHTPECPCVHVPVYSCICVHVCNMRFYVHSIHDAVRYYVCVRKHMHVHRKAIY